MSSKSIEMKKLNGQGEYDTLYPKTVSSNVVISDELIAEAKNEIDLDEVSTLDSAFLTVDTALTRKQDRLPIGTILASVCDLGEEYLPIDSVKQVRVDEYPELYNKMGLEQLSSGWVDMGAISMSDVTYIDYYGGAYWLSNGSDIWYKKSLDSNWVSVGSPKDRYYGDYFFKATRFVKRIGNDWFWCGEVRKSQSSVVNIVLRYAKVSDIISGAAYDWYAFGSVSENDTLMEDPKELMYINECYVLFGQNDTNSIGVWRCYSLTTKEWTEISISYSQPTSIPNCKIMGVNGYWYLYYYISSHGMGIFGADSFVGLKEALKTVVGQSYYQVDSSLSQKRIVNDIGNRCVIEYKNQKYYIYTLTGVYISDKPLSDFEYNSEHLIWDGALNSQGDYYWMSNYRKISPTNTDIYQTYIKYSHSFDDTVKECIVSETIGSNVEKIVAFNYVNGVGYAVSNAKKFYINNGEFYNLPLVYFKESPIVHYVKVK